jgi:hypothetical protein
MIRMPFPLICNVEHFQRLNCIPQLFPVQSWSLHVFPLQYCSGNTLVTPEVRMGAVTLVGADYKGQALTNPRLRL